MKNKNPNFKYIDSIHIPSLVICVGFKTHGTKPRGKRGTTQNKGMIDKVLV